MKVFSCCLIITLYTYILNVYKNIKFYFQSTSIHGLNNVFRCKSWYEVVFWLVIFICASVNFYYLLIYNIIRYTNQQVLQVIDTTAYPISLVPFPAVTICSVNFVYKPKSDRMKAILVGNGINEEAANIFFHSMILLKYPQLVNTSQFAKIYQVLAANGYSDNEKIMEDLAQPCDTLLQQCFWAGQQKNCSTIFSQSKADMGLCCSFNSDLYPVKKYYKPQYYSSAGPTSGLYVRFNMSTVNQVSNRQSGNIVVVYVHGKADYAEDTAFNTYILPGREKSMKIVPETYEASLELKEVSTKARKCLLDGEGPRVLNQRYSFANCMHTCKKNAIGNLCGCLPHFYPDLGIWDSCTLMNLFCLQKYMDNYTTLYIKSDKHGNTNYNEDMACDCLPSCSGTKYRGSLETHFYQNYQQFSETAGVRIYFRKNRCKKFALIKSTTVDTLIALIGGLFALCVGGSLVSLVEVLYFVLKSFLIDCRRQTRHKENKKLPDLYWSELVMYRKRPTLYNNKRSKNSNAPVNNFIN